MDTFKEKVQSMTGKEIMQAMITGLHKEWVKVNMSTYGTTVEKKVFGFTRTVCVGCAATNTVCQIVGKPFKKNVIEYTTTQAKELNTNEEFYDLFLSALNYLRCGYLEDYNYRAKLGGFGTIDKDCKLPVLHTKTYKQFLDEYQECCDSLPNTHTYVEN